MVFPNSKAGCSRVPPQSATLTAQYCYFTDPVRLACLIHATSVRSEPESNSQKKEFEKLLTQTFTVPCLFRRFIAEPKSHVSSIHFSKIDVVLDSVSLAFRRISRNGCIVYHFVPPVCKGENEKTGYAVDATYTTSCAPPPMMEDLGLGSVAIARPASL